MLFILTGDGVFKKFMKKIPWRKNSLKKTPTPTPTAQSSPPTSEPQHSPEETPSESAATQSPTSEEKSQTEDGEKPEGRGRFRRMLNSTGSRMKAGFKNLTGKLKKKTAVEMAEELAEERRKRESASESAKSATSPSQESKGIDEGESENELDPDLVRERGLATVQRNDELHLKAFGSLLDVFPAKKLHGSKGERPR